ncbi:MAG TPA: hypothetical protein VML01_00445 [Bryobacterales bacterium]|nr:hypothetical protein [Bryobacterales bacterium]
MNLRAGYRLTSERFTPWWRLTLITLLVAGSSFLAGQTPLSDDSVVSFRVRFGLTDEAPRAWDGQLTVERGEILGLRNWSPHPADEIIGTSGWRLATRPGANYSRRVYQWEDPRGTEQYVTIPGLIVDVSIVSSTRIGFTTAHGDFEVWPHELQAGAPMRLLNGAVEVDRVPPAERVSSGSADSDFATVLGGADGEMWAAWVAYRDKSNRVEARRFDGERWQPAETVSGDRGDVFLVKMGRDKQQRPWVIWSEQAAGNFDLYGRYRDGSGWSRVERLTDAPQSDIQHAVATDAKGNLWLTWQGFRDGKSDIFVRSFDGEKWSAERKISTSAANDWKPAIAADSTGGVYVAWDTYDRGNYDVVMRRWSGESWGELIPVAGTPKFEAHVTLVCDNQDRLWAAWNESGFQWGKDSGFLIYKEATRLYQWRALGVGVYSGGRWQTPAADINTALPAELHGYNDLPVLETDAAGRVWLFFRHRFLRARDVPDFTPAHRAAWQVYGVAYAGERWTQPLHLPFSRGRQDVRWGIARGADGGLIAAWPTDHRDADTYVFEKTDVYAGKLPALAGAAAQPRLVDRKERQFDTYPVHPNEELDLKRIRDYKIESAGKTYRIYRGDTHRHTEFSDDGYNDGSQFETYRYALDAASLDFMGVSEHNSGSGQDNEYINWLLPQYADLFNLPGTFASIFTYERSLSYPNGHRNILTATRGIPTLPIPAAEARGDTGAERLYEYLKKYNAIAISHTSATGMGTDWRDNDPEVEPLVEIYQGDRVSAEYEGAPRAATSEMPYSQQGGLYPAGYVWNAWAKGYKLGVQASSDHISTHISYACTITEDFSREGLLDAMRKRHSYGATDNIILDYRLQTGGKEYLQGDIVEAAGGFKLWINVIGTSRIEQIDIIKNNTFVHTRQNLKEAVNFTFVDNDVAPGESYYYVRVQQKNREMAWSSPIWVRTR